MVARDGYGRCSNCLEREKRDRAAILKRIDNASQWIMGER